MTKLVYCVGTATEVGKTHVGALVLTELRQRGRAFSACKPVQSFDPADGGPLDAEVLAAATGQAADDVCPPDRTFPVAMAPPMAAAALGRPCPSLAQVVTLVPSGDVWVEGVGGPRSPMASDGDGVDLCRALRPDHVVLVADAGLGTINAVALSVAPFVDCKLTVFLNRYDDGDDLHRRNQAWLVDRLELDVVTSPEALAERL